MEDKESIPVERAKQESKLSRLLSELLETERKYVQDLEQVKMGVKCYSNGC